MKVGRIFLGLMLVLVCVGFVSAVSYEYTSGTDTTCDNGVCTKTLYSGVRNVYEDNQWKKIEDAKSLVGSGITPIVLEDDKDFPVEVIDYNYTSIKVKLNPKGVKMFNEDIPIRIWDVKDEDSKINNFKNTYKNIIDEKISFNLLNHLFHHIPTKFYYKLVL